MPGVKKELKDQAPLKARITWREYYGSITRTRMYPNFQKEMLLNHVGADGEIEYQGLIIDHVLNEGDKQNPEFVKYEVIYNAEFVAELLFDQFTDLGFLINGKPNPKYWDKWLNPDTGEIAKYSATEGLRRQEQQDLLKAKDLVETIGQTVEFWMESFKRARESGGESPEAQTSTGNGKRKTAKV